VKWRGPRVIEDLSPSSGACQLDYNQYFVQPKWRISTDGAEAAGWLRCEPKWWSQFNTYEECEEDHRHT
jgi:hypothetical protein